MSNVKLHFLKFFFSIKNMYIDKNNFLIPDMTIQKLIKKSEKLKKKTLTKHNFIKVFC